MTVRSTLLPSGLRVVTHRMESVETVSLGAWIAVGTRHERADVNGIAHMVEHMAFKGTRRRSARAIAEEIEAVGGHLNAYTSREFTAFHASVLAGDEGLALDIVADILQHAVLNAEELERERAVILREIGQSNDTPEDVVFDRFQATAFPDQPVGRPTLGTPELVGAIERGALVEYIARHYTADRIVVAAAGKVDHDDFVRAVENAFGGLQAARAVAPEPAVYSGGDGHDVRPLARLPQLGGFEDANRLIFGDWTLKGRHYTAFDGRPVRAPSGGDPRGRLLRQSHAELVQQQLVLLVRPGVTRQDELPAVGSR